jgi:ubiquinone/menaquinone biosynthesis C-methylase UbiE
MTSTPASQQLFGTTYGGSDAENYERYFVPVIGDPLARELVETANLRQGERVLDVACGTGVVARLAAKRVGVGGTVAALDINAGMLAVARALTPPPRPHIRWYETTAESIPLPDDSFDAVFCQLGLQFVPDKRAALREMRRVVTPHGRVLVSVPTPPPFFDVIDEALSRRVPDAAGFVRVVFSLNDTAAIDGLFRDAGFRTVSITTRKTVFHLPAPEEFFWQYVHSTPLARILGNVDAETLGALERDVVERWQPWVERDAGMAYEQAVIVATAGK